MADKASSRWQPCRHIRPGRTFFVALECWETDAQGNPLRVLGYNTHLTPRYELWGCRDCGQIFLKAVKEAEPC